MFNLTENKKEKQAVNLEDDNSFSLKFVITVLLSLLLPSATFMFDLYLNLDQRLDQLNEQIALASQESTNKTELELLANFGEKVIQMEKRINFLEEKVSN